MLQNIKGSLLASFFICSTLNCAPSFSSTEHLLDESKQWQALLHHSEQKLGVNDQGFYLSTKNSLRNELAAQLKSLKSTSDDACRFPARQFWLSQQLEIEPPNLSRCSELKEFLEQVPYQQISLVFSSENLASPSSMMGHILLKLSGNDAKGHYKEYGISFYTDITGINVPKIIFESLVTGKKGFFALSPYKEKLNLYLRQEGRNVWEYELDFTEQQKKLLMLHIWELKQAKLDYFFDTYNCATLTNYMLAVAEPELLPNEVNNISPLDVIKKVVEGNYVKRTRVLTSTAWEARMLMKAASDKTLEAAKYAFRHRDKTKIEALSNFKDRFIAINLVKKFHLLDDGENVLDEVERLTEIEEAISDKYEIDLSEFKIPTKTPADSQWSVGLTYEDDQTYTQFSYLPASHDLDDDNRQYFSENALELASISILANQREIILDKFSLYRAISIIPHQEVLGGLSGQFHLGLVRSYDRDLDKEHTFDIAVGLGKAYEPHDAITLYGLTTAGVGYGKTTAFGYLNPALGLIIREKNNYKTRIELNFTWNEFNEHTGITELSVTQAKYLGKDWGVFFNYNKAFAAGQEENSFTLKVKKYF